MDHKINLLQAKYRQRIGDRKIDPKLAVEDMHQKYKDRFSNVIDAMAVACSVTHIVTPDGIDLSKLTPEMVEAFHLQYPNMTMEHLQTLSPEQLHGVVSGWTGKLFEVIVRDKLNSGEWVGDIHLHAGLHAVLAQSATQPGWDLEIVNHAGVPVDFLQMKATDSLSYIKSALEKYPQFHIVTTSEIFNNGSHISDALMHHLTNSGISDDHLRIAVEHFAQHGTGFEEHLAQLVPWLSFLIIGGTEGYSLLRGRKKVREAFLNTMDRSAKTGIVMGIVEIIEAFGVSQGWGIPISILLRLGMTRESILKEIGKRFKARNDQLALWSNMHQAQ